jgi:hypothetical protein
VIASLYSSQAVGGELWQRRNPPPYPRPRLQPLVRARGLKIYSEISIFDCPLETHTFYTHHAFQCKHPNTLLSLKLALNTVVMQNARTYATTPPAGAGRPAGFVGSESGRWSCGQAGGGERLRGEEVSRSLPRQGHRPITPCPSIPRARPKPVTGINSEAYTLMDGERASKQGVP